LETVTERINKIMIIRTLLVITGLLLKGIWQRLKTFQNEKAHRLCWKMVVSDPVGQWRPVESPLISARARVAEGQKKTLFKAQP